MDHLYLVTRSNHYYPQEACGDWLLVTDDLDKATDFYEAEVEACDHYQTVYLIHVPAKKVMRTHSPDDS